MAGGLFAGSSGSKLVDKTIWVVKVLAVVGGLRPDEEVVMVEDFVQAQDSIEVIIGAGEEMVDLIL